MTPFLVESKIRAVSLYQLRDGRFQMIKQGNLSPFMNGFDYILIDEELAGFLNSVDISHIEIIDAIVWNRETEVEYKNYRQLVVNKYFTEENFQTQNLKGMQMYMYGNGNLFVSPELKELLEKSKFDYLSFSEGYIRFV